jgi:O-antigen/teichoic acid export membrane protein
LIRRKLTMPLLAHLHRARVRYLGLGIADQGFSVGGMFLANVVLARVASREEYGMFALAYSILNFLAGLHNAAIIEPYTVHGAGRYRIFSAEYRWLIWRNNAWLVLALTAVLLIIWKASLWTSAAVTARALLGLALSTGVVLTSYLLRRILYVQRKVESAAWMSFVFLLCLTVCLTLTAKFGLLNAFSVFMLVGLGSIVGGAAIYSEIPRPARLQPFISAQPHHHREHWKYARWVLATAFVFQFANQAYYWLVAGLLSLKEVAALRAITMIVMIVDQVFIAITSIVLPALAARFASNQIAELLSLWRLYLGSFLAVGGVFFAGVMVFGKPVIHWIYGGKFDDVSAFLSTLALLPILMGVGHTMNAALKSVEKPNAVFYAYVASGITTLGLGIPFMTHFGLRGAVYGMLASAGAYTITLTVGFLRNVFRLPVLGVAAREEVLTS